MSEKVLQHPTASSVAVSRKSDKDGDDYPTELFWKGISGCAWEDGAQRLEPLAGN